MRVSPKTRTLDAAFLRYPNPADHIYSHIDHSYILTGVSKPDTLHLCEVTRVGKTKCQRLNEFQQIYLSN